MKRSSLALPVLLVLLTLGALLGAPARAALFGVGDLRALSDAITEIDLERAQKLAAGIDSETPQFLVERGRMLLYLGNCVGSAAKPRKGEKARATAHLDPEPVELSRRRPRQDAGSRVDLDRGS